VKIDDPLGGIPAIRSRESRKQKGNAAKAPIGGNATDSVEITQTSAKLRRLEEALAQMDSADTGKVESVKQAIAEGRFQVDEEAVADALVQGAMEQLRLQRKVEK
jgi:negative regulator of flagellin synthesis FlgM